MDKDLTFVLWVGDRRANRIGAVTKRVGNALGGQDFTAWTGHTIAITLDWARANALNDATKRITTDTASATSATSATSASTATITASRSLWAMWSIGCRAACLYLKKIGKTKLAKCNKQISEISVDEKYYVQSLQ